MTTSIDTCKRKIRYSSKAQARQAVKIVKAMRGHDGQREYHCRFCQGYHIGHLPRLRWELI